MEKTRILLALIAIGALGIHNVNAGSAVVADGHANLSTAYGGPVDREKQRALDTAHRRYGFGHFRILAASDVTGYGAIAVALHPNGRDSLIGIALGRRSATEADSLAIKECEKAGGRHARVRWAFWG